MSSAKPKSKSSVKAAIGAVRDFIGGHQEEEAVSTEQIAISNSEEVIPPPQPVVEEVKMEKVTIEG